MEHTTRKPVESRIPVLTPSHSKNGRSQGFRNLNMFYKTQLCANSRRVHTQVLSEICHRRQLINRRPPSGGTVGDDADIAIPASLLADSAYPIRLCKIAAVGDILDAAGHACV